MKKFMIYHVRLQAQLVGLPTMGTVGHATRRVLRSTMTRALAAQLNWAAQRGSKTGIVAYRHIVFGIAGDVFAL